MKLGVVDWFPLLFNLSKLIMTHMCGHHGILSFYHGLLIILPVKDIFSEFVVPHTRFSNDCFTIVDDNLTPNIPESTRCTLKSTITPDRVRMHAERVPIETRLIPDRVTIE